MSFKKLFLIFSLFFVSLYVQASKQELIYFLYSISKNHFRVVQEMLEKDPSLASKQYRKGLTPLHLVKSFGISRLLLEAGANPNAQENNYKHTPLHLIMLLKDVKLIEKKEIAEILLKAGANPNIQNKKGVTPLHYVEDFEIAKFLIEAGANPNAQENNYKHTPLHLIMLLKDVKSFEKIKLAELLLSHGADPNIKDNLEMTPLHYIVNLKYFNTSEKTELIKIFLRYGTDPNIKDINGKSLIDFNNNPEITELVKKVSKNKCARVFNSL